MKICIGIKALNEERHIAATLTAALAAARPFGGEVILADSGSSDGTIAIAKSFPVTIVQLADFAERSCGAGAQLAFAHSNCDYFYLLDGDMVMDGAFLPAAVAYLEAHPEVAGVGGLVREANLTNAEFQIRARAAEISSDLRPGFVDRLDGGGLYRAQAIRALGYFTDRNLHSFEELELAIRLENRGWKLARLNLPAVIHHGHTVDGFTLLFRRLSSGYASGAGEVLRGALGKPELTLVLGRLSHIRHAVMVIFWWLALVAAAVWQPWMLLALVAVPLVLLAIRRRSWWLGLYSFATWNVFALAFIAGLLRKRRPPQQPIGFNLLQARPDQPDRIWDPIPASADRHGQNLT